MSTTDQPAPANNHAVSTFVVTVVHPRDEDPEDYTAALANAAMDMTDHGISVSHASSVGTYIDTTPEAVESGGDIPDWLS